MMVCSTPHPHGQVWPLSEVLLIPAIELSNMRKYSISSQSSSEAPTGPERRACLLCEYAHFEMSETANGERLVIKNDVWAAIVPWWAVWPFESLRKTAFSHFLI